MFNLNSKKVLITGGSRGIGAACVKYFCMAGASVAFTYNTSSGLAARLEKRFSKISKCKAYKVDINNEEEIKKTVQMVIKDFGRIDVLVNNAGIWKEAKISKMKRAAWDETIKTNLTSTFFLHSKFAIL
ncbi:MAG TPA: SDR family NAD(P)-dependent oxidoreductase [Ignavibacteriaceae bacterium]|nr:SDR family NAD(P)-dependent oxidoreductase [Ignavibacteriaceae bacterium]